MGMFDYIRCERPLPDGWQPSELQTKDFDCDMVTHVITAAGRLELEHIDEQHLVPKEERPYPDAPEGSLLAMAGCLRTVCSRHDANFHGHVRFYGIENDTNDPDARWHEYSAKFTNGDLVMGGHPRNATEHIIIATRGEPVSDRHASATLNWLEHPRVGHSVKPAVFRDTIERLSPAPRIELFAREKTLGWDAWGNEVASDVWAA